MSKLSLFFISITCFLFFQFRTYSSDEKGEYKALPKVMLDPLISIAHEHEFGEKSRAYRNKLMGHNGPAMGRALGYCRGTLTLEKMENIDLVFVINQEGKASKIFWSQNKTADCVINQGLLNWFFFKPLHKDFHFWLHIDMVPPGEADLPILPTTKNK